MTNTAVTRFIEPLDVLFLRGNSLFGDAGSYGDALMPPWPSVAAGALRSHILVNDGFDLAAFARGSVEHPRLGTPQKPGSFVLDAFQLARRTPQGAELLMPLPADVVVTAKTARGTIQAETVRTIRPIALHERLTTSSPLERAPVLAQGKNREKPASGWWLTAAGWQKYLGGRKPGTADLIHASRLWRFDERVGVGLDSSTRSAAEGHLFTNRAIAMNAGVGFAVAVTGASVPRNGTLRLGGDGRAAALHDVQLSWPEPDYEAISTAGCCRIVLTSPGIFTGGWMPPGMENGQRLQLPGLSARVVAAAVSRSDTVSGWDLARRGPKPALKTAAAGSVYWLQDLQATPEALRKLVANGLWGGSCEDAQRRAEGFNRFSFAAC